VAQETWALNIAAFTGASAGGKLNAAGGAADPLTNTLEGYADGTAGAKIRNLPLIGKMVALLGK
jgi:hypothetical protein